MNQITDTLRDSKRLRLIATALELMQYERTDSAVIPIPGTEPQRYVVVGTAATVARLLGIAPAASTVSAPSKTQSAPISTPAIGAPHSDTLAAASAEGRAAPVEQFDWLKAERIRDEDHVDEALRVFREDPTGDNATGVIQAALTVWTADVRSEQDRAPAADAGGVSQRTEFESCKKLKDFNFTRDSRGAYTSAATRGGWKAWQAALTNRAPATSAAALGEPTMLWDAEDGEAAYGNDPKEFAGNYAADCMMPGQESDVEVTCAYRGHNRTMRIVLDQNHEVSWSWVDDRAAAKGAGGVS